MVVLGGLDSGDLSCGLADDVLGESLGLSVPLGYSVAVSDHAVIIAELHLGALERGLGDLAVLIEADVGLSCIVDSGKDLSVSTDNGCAELGVHLDDAVCVSGGIGGLGCAGLCSKAESESAVRAEAHGVDIAAGLDNGILEAGDLNGAGSVESLICCDRVAMVVLNGLNSCDLFAGLADNVLFKCLCLSI